MHDVRKTGIGRDKWPLFSSRKRAVAELQGRNFIWVIDAENKASQRSVKVGETIGGNVLISEGLKPGERIVVEGLQKVREGAPVQPMSAEDLAEAAKKAEGERPAETVNKAGETKHNKD